MLSRGKMHTNNNKIYLQSFKEIEKRNQFTGNSNMEQMRLGQVVLGVLGIFGVLRVRGCWWCIGNLRSLFLSFVVCGIEGWIF